LTQGPNIQERLREGIDAARRGDRLTARRMLQQVLAYDRNNELALMWMASVVDTPEERISFLQRTLQVNPDNARAREALRRLGGDIPAAPAPRIQADPPPRPRPAAPPPAPTVGDTPRRSNNTYLFLAGAVLVIMVVVVGAVLLNPSRSGVPAIPTAQGRGTLQAFLNPTATPTRDTSPPTATVFTGVIVTFDPGMFTPLPPTFTPTLTPTNTPTPFPSPTPLMLDSFRILYSDFEPNVALPSLYRADANGLGEVKLASGTTEGFTDLALSRDGTQIAFIRPVSTEGNEIFSQLFIAPFNDPSAARAVTNLRASIVSSPAWSPDGQRVVFVANDAQGTHLFRYSVATGEVVALTRGRGRNIDPSYTPNGDILFATDRDSPGFTEIYRMSGEGQNPVRLTDDAGSSFAPIMSPDGARIAFISDRAGDADLYVMDADGQRAFLITIDDNGAEDHSPAWSPNSRYIAFASNREGGVFAWYAADLLDRNRITRLTNNDRFPQSLNFIP
jgi:Tol biopolymer transport system component